MTSRRNNVVRREVMAFAIPGFILLGLLAATSVWLASSVARQETVRDATVAAEIVARTAIEPALTDGLASGDPQSIAVVDEVVRTRLLTDPTVTVRIWSEDGQILYSDKPQLIGRTYGLGQDSLAVLTNGGVEAEVSDLSKPENQYERNYGQLVEVYLPVTAPDGTRYLLELYQRQSFLDTGARRILGALAPVVLGSLAVLATILLMLAWRMVRRLDQDRVRREQLLVHAVDSSNVERRRIAADLHDGVVQDLVGVSFSLAAMAQQNSDPAERGRLEQSANRTRRAIGSLRTLLVDIYPPNLGDTGLSAALSDLFRSLDCDVRLDVEDLPHVPEHLQQAIYRIARESAQNIKKHARAQHVQVHLRAAAGDVILTIVDDGVGFVLTDRPGHLGLQLIDDLAAQVGGLLEVRSVPGDGTTVTFEAPIT